ncbi:MAG: glycosyltransferase [Thermodesulfobacteriota bacterium]
MKLAIIHDWLIGMRGGEKVLEALCELYPDAHIYTLFHVKGSVSKTIEDRMIKTSFVQRLPFSKRFYRYYLPLYPLAVEGFELKDYDIVISLSHCVAKGVIPPPNAIHIAYTFTPMRYVWDMRDSYFPESNWFSRKIVGLFSHYLRMWDVSSSARVDDFVAISNHVAKRIEKYYRRKASVIYPPVDCSAFGISGKTYDYYLIVSAFAPYKRIDLAIEAFNNLGLKLKIVGTGQDEKRLKRMAGKNIEFLGWQSNAALKGLYAGCKAFIFPGEEDFGIAPLEAMASGRPVIAYAKGGALETVVPLGVKERAPTGLFFVEQTPGSLAETVCYFEKKEGSFDSASIREHALKFDKAVFKKNMAERIREKYLALKDSEDVKEKQ